MNLTPSPSPRRRGGPNQYGTPESSSGVPYLPLGGPGGLHLSHLGRCPRVPAILAAVIHSEFAFDGDAPPDPIPPGGIQAGSALLENADQFSVNLFSGTRSRTLRALMRGRDYPVILPNQGSPCHDKQGNNRSKDQRQKVRYDLVFHAGACFLSPLGIWECLAPLGERGAEFENLKVDFSPHC